MMFPEIELTWIGTGLHLHTYTLFLFLSIGIGLIWAFSILRRVGLSVPRSLGVCCVVGTSFITGARVLNYALNHSKYSQMGIFILEPKLSYFSLYGGVLLSVGALYILVKWNRLSMKRIFDGLTTPFLLSFSLMKVGCFLNGCCYGTRTTAIIGIPLPLAQRQTWAANPFVTALIAPEQIRVYPVQLMEALAAVGIALLLFCFRKRLREGSVFFAAAFLFSGARLFLLQIRSTGYALFIVETLYPALYWGIITIGLTLFIRNEQRCGIR